MVEELVRKAGSVVFGQMASQNTEHIYTGVVRQELLDHVYIWSIWKAWNTWKSWAGEGKSGTGTLVVAYF